MPASLSEIEDFEPGDLGLEAHLRRVAIFRHNVKTKTRGSAKPYPVFVSELGNIFSKGELSVLLTAFVEFAPCEIVSGEVMATHEFMQLPHDTFTDPDVHRYYFPAGAWERFQMRGMSMARPATTRSYTEPKPAYFDDDGRPVYLRESREQRIVRQLEEGKYLFKDLGGLTGGFGFYVSYEVQGHDFDTSVKRGEFMSNIGNVLSAARSGMQHKNKWAAKSSALATPGRPYSPGKPLYAQAPSKPDSLKYIPALPKPRDLGPDAHMKVAQLFKALVSPKSKTR